ncbi:MAG: glycosidase [Treponema socranskii subsp. buccale]
MTLVRCKENPIVVPGQFPWRKAAVFNPAVILHNGEFYMIERAAGQLRPFNCYFGLQKSTDGIHFTPVQDEPVVTSSSLGFPYGSIQDPRIIKIEDTFYLTYALRPSSYGYSPTGTGKPDEISYDYPGEHGKPESFMTRSGIMESTDLLHFRQVSYTTPFEINDRDNVLFPEKIDGKFVLLRRPEEYIGKSYGTEKPSIWISYSDDLKEWSKPELLATPSGVWDSKKVGASAPPVKTKEGWLLLFHGVDEDNIYRCGAMMLDKDDPSKVIARAKSCILEPHEYYERFGLYIPNVVFPTAAVEKDGILYIYYGCCDTAISLATVPLDELIDFVMSGK